jgi:hypothetical protein
MHNAETEPVPMSSPHTQEEWLRLDNAAKIYPASDSDVAPPVFRVAVTLREPLQIGPLNEALLRMNRRTPYYQVELKRGFFWYYLQQHKQVARVELLADAPVKHISMRRDTQLFSVQAKGSTVAADFCHILTDGYGAMRYLCSLIVDYLRLIGYSVDPGDRLLNPDEDPSPEEFEDAYRRLFRKGAPKAPDLPPAYHIPGIPGPRHRGITARIPLAAALQVARASGVTLTEYIVGAYIASIAEIHRSRRKSFSRPRSDIIRIEVPVNMRKLYPSVTMRNFSLFVSPEIDLRLGDYAFSDIVQRVHHSMNMQVHATELTRQIARNVGGELNPFVRVIPRPIKYLYLRYLSHTIGSRSYSGVVSNLGRFILPDQAAPHVRSVGFSLGSNPQYKTNCAVTSFDENLFVTFGSVVESREVERGTIEQFMRDGLRVGVTEAE